MKITYVAVALLGLAPLLGTAAAADATRGTVNLDRPAAVAPRVAPAASDHGFVLAYNTPASGQTQTNQHGTQWHQG
jgi:hypothetical protein